MSGIRHNQNKLRFDLVSPVAIEKMAEVLTKGCEKYPENNWRKGLPWIKGVTASIDRHLNAFKQGEDTDPESGLLHMAHIATNVMFLLEFYKTHPECDDREQIYGSVSSGNCTLQNTGSVSEGHVVIDRCRVSHEGTVFYANGKVYSKHQPVTVKLEKQDTTNL
jgi:hypothetical protein